MAKKGKNIFLTFCISKVCFFLLTLLLYFFFSKMFVGGLSWMSSVESLRAYFERFGEIDECVIMRDAKTKMTRYVCKHAAYYFIESSFCICILVGSAL